MNSAPGTIIVLNGPSSAGKSSVLRALQSVLPDPFLEAGLDKFLWMLPARYRTTALWNDVLGHADRAGHEGHRLVESMHHAIAALVRAGSNVVADHVLIEPTWLPHCMRLFEGLPTLFVGITCPVETLDQRERDRKDRTVGQGRMQHGLVHLGARYDLVLDTSQLTPEQAAAIIASHLRSVGTSLSFNTGSCSVASSDSACLEPTTSTSSTTNARR